MSIESVLILAGARDVGMHSEKRGIGQWIGQGRWIVFRAIVFQKERKITSL